MVPLRLTGLPSTWASKRTGGGFLSAAAPLRGASRITQVLRELGGYHWSL
jgi:hypothetical protein